MAAVGLEVLVAARQQIGTNGKPALVRHLLAAKDVFVRGDALLFRSAELLQDRFVLYGTCAPKAFHLPLEFIAVIDQLDLPPLSGNHDLNARNAQQPIDDVLGIGRLRVNCFEIILRNRARKDAAAEVRFHLAQYAALQQ